MMRNIKSSYLRVNKAKKKATLIIDRLNLGNNFTYSHFIGAINERLNQCNKLIELIDNIACSIDSDFELEIIAKGNFCHVSDTFIIFEFFELLNDDRF